MTLSERERYVLLCIIYAANEASEHTGHKGIYAGTPQYDYWLTDTMMRSLLPFLDLHLVVITDNSKAIEKLTDSVPQNFHDEYLFHFHDRQRSDQSEITLQEAEKLHDRAKTELKEYVAAHKSKPQILYISDCHFYHDNLCRNLDHRGFIDFEEMNEFMIKQWNSRVTPKDDVYILGDFCFGKGDAAERIIKQLKGKLHLIIGNHDRFLQDKSFDRSLFRSIEPYSEIRDKGRTVILSHYPVFCYKGQYRKKYGRQSRNIYALWSCA